MCYFLNFNLVLQVSKSEHIHSVLCVEIVYNDQLQHYVVCLCSSCLKLFTSCSNQWTCVATTRLGFIVSIVICQDIHQFYRCDDCDYCLTFYADVCSHLGFWRIVQRSISEYPLFLSRAWCIDTEPRFKVPSETGDHSCDP